MLKTIFNFHNFWKQRIRNKRIYHPVSMMILFFFFFSFRFLGSKPKRLYGVLFIYHLFCTFRNPFFNFNILKKDWENLNVIFFNIPLPMKYLLIKVFSKLSPYYQTNQWNQTKWIYFLMSINTPTWIPKNIAMSLKPRYPPCKKDYENQSISTWWRISSFNHFTFK